MKNIYLIVLLSSFSLTSCSSLVNVRYSHPYIGSEKVNEMVIDAKDLVLHIRAANLYISEPPERRSERLLVGYYYTGNSLPQMNRNSFIIEIIIESEKEIDILPSRFVLNLNDRLLMPKVYKTEVLGEVRSYQKFRGTFCDFREKGRFNSPDAYRPQKRFEIKKEITLQPSIKHCFALKFDTPPPNPKSNFSLRIDGIEYDGLLPTVINFRESKDTWLLN